MRNLKYLLLAGIILSSITHMSAMDKLQSDVTEIKEIVTRILSYHGCHEKGVAVSATPMTPLRPIDVHRKINMLMNMASHDPSLVKDVLAAIAEAKAKGIDFDFIPGSSENSSLLYKANQVYSFGKSEETVPIIKALTETGAIKKECS